MRAEVEKMAHRSYAGLYARTMTALDRLERLSLSLDDENERWSNLAISMRAVIAQERAQIDQDFHP